MAEHDAERAGSEEEREPLPAEGAAVPDDGTGQEESAPRKAAPGGEGGREGSPVDEDAAWRAIVAGYGEEPPDPPGAKPFRSVEDLALLEDDGPAGPEVDKGLGKKLPRPPEKPLGSSVVFAPGVMGPRDYGLAEPKDDDLDESDEGHFVPPEPPPLPEADATAKFAWLGVVGGPVLMLLAVVLGWEMTWWFTTVCVVGFLGGFVTLVARMNDDGEDDEDPGRGAVV
ncbi:hypothetical protein [Streptomyces sp. NPDC001108]